ncbi:MAG TPA: extracellular solute-binding protein, partial [Rhizobium sp.]|nr:extracellular solute-binding protein [Rhizobium sp.]
MTLKTLLLTASTLALAAAAAPAMAADYSRFGIPADLPGTCSYEAIDAKDYSGRTLNIITHAVPVIGEPTALHAKQFEELTGAKVSVVHVPFGDLFQRILIPFQTGQNAYDVLFYGSLWIGDLNPFLAPVPDAYRESTGMKDVTRNYIDVAKWGDQMVQYPIDGDRHYLKYRADMFENPEMQAKFKEATGRDLTVPATWEEYNEVAKVFSGWDWDGDGNPNYGSAEVAK